MKPTTLCIAALLPLLNTACTVSTVKQEPVVEQAKGQHLRQNEEYISDSSPSMTRVKSGKTLKLVRLMDGGACKNDKEGVRGIFLLYADPEGSEKIKNEQGVQVFAEFEKRIESFSLIALKQAVQKSSFDKNPFALGSSDAERVITKGFIQQFDKTIAPSLENFEQETKLLIDVVPYRQGLIFYTQGCDATHVHQEGGV
ncbi:MAG: hypothetical protein ACU84J_01790 [Gammaproteobacteria bacterium]